MEKVQLKFGDNVLAQTANEDDVPNYEALLALSATTRVVQKPSNIYEIPILQHVVDGPKGK